MVRSIAGNYAAGRLEWADAIEAIASVIGSEPPQQPGPVCDDFRLRTAADGLTLPRDKGWIDDEFIDEVLAAVEQGA